MNITHAHTFGIIGGRGRTGTQFARMLRKAGFRVLVTGAADSHRNPTLLKKCDVVIFAVPLDVSVDIIRDTLRHATRRDQLILDVSSLKTEQVRAMLGAKGEVIGMHPLFGPASEPTGPVILCPGRAKPQTLVSLKKLLVSLGLRAIVMTPLAHDRLMGYVQAMPHCKSLLMADLLMASKADLDIITRSCTPTYQLEFNVIGRFLDDDPALYMPIIFGNPATLPMLKKLKGIVEDYIQIASSANLVRASQRYALAKAYFGKHTRRARAQSEDCIRVLSK